MDLWVVALWGLMGAFVYAAPRLLLLLSAKVDARRVIFGIAEFLVALTIGAIGATGFSAFIGAAIHQTNVGEIRAVALTLGMIANPVAPTIVHVLSTGVVRRLGAPGMRNRSERR